LALLFVVAGSASDVSARGFGGGGGFRGGGGAGFGGAGFGGHTGGAAFRSPSMSRPSFEHFAAPRFDQMRSRPMEYARPSMPVDRSFREAPRVATRPEMGRRPADAVASRPSREQLQQFLNLPAGPARDRASDLAKIGAGAAAGALGAEGVRQLLDRTRPGGLPGAVQLPERPRLGDRPPLGDRADVRDRPAQLPAKPTADQIRNNIHNRYDNLFTPQWWKDHPQAARAYWDNFGKYRWDRHHWWRPVTWAALMGWIAGASSGAAYSDPVYYNYGDNVYYDGDNVYVLGTQVATAAEYYQQADDLAMSAPDAMPQQGDDWMPLGVFALSQENAQDSNMVLQLAVSKEGVISGTYYNATTDTVRPIKGKVDRKSQRAAWTFADGKNTDIVMETGIYNLTQDQTEALVHFGKDKTQQWLMVRLQQPESQKEAAAGSD